MSCELRKQWRNVYVLGRPFATLSDRSLSLPFVCLSVLSVTTLVYCGQTVGWIKMKLGTQVGLGPGHIVLDGDPAPLPKGHPQFSANICCSQRAGWINMPLCMEVGLGPGDFVLDGDPASPREKGTAAPQLSAHVCCGHGRPSPLLLRSCCWSDTFHKAEQNFLKLLLRHDKCYSARRQLNNFVVINGLIVSFITRSTAASRTTKANRFPVVATWLSNW